MKDMFVYSGECRLCKVGIETELIGDQGEVLRTGDIVIVYVISRDTGICSLHGMTVVVARHYRNVQCRDPEELSDDEKEAPFIMGNKSSDFNEETEDNYPKTVWRANRVKKYEDVIDGEKWVEFGFNYKGIAR